MFSNPKYVKKRRQLYSSIKRGIANKYEKLSSKLPSADISKMGAFVGMEYIDSNPHIEWDYLQVSRNKELTVDYVVKHHLRNWDWKVTTILLINKNEWDYVFNYPDLDWHWKEMSYRAPWELISKYPDKPWRWNGISWRYDLKEYQIRLFPDKPWITEYFDDRVSWELVRDLPHLNWRWYQLETRECFTWELVRIFPEKTWCWEDLSRLDKIPSDIFLDNIDKNWRVNFAIQNIEVREEDVLRIESLEDPKLKYALLKKGWNEIGYYDDFVGIDLLQGVGGKSREEEVIIHHARQHMAAFTIQNRWRNICVDSYHPLGEKIIKQRFLQLQEEMERLPKKA